MAGDEGQVLTETRIPEAYCVCTYSYYRRLCKGEIPGKTVNPYVIYLVNHGVEPTGSPSNIYTDLYYGRNKLSDLQILEVTSGQFDEDVCTTVPNNKIIVELKRASDTSGNGNGTERVEVVGLAVKYNDQVLLLKELTAVKTDGDGSKFLNDKGEYTTPPGEYTGTQYVTVDNTNHTISTTYYAGANITIDADGKISASGGGGGGGGPTYTAGDGIEVTDTQDPDIKEISINNGSGLTINETSHELEVDFGQVNYESSDYITVNNTSGNRSVSLKLAELINKLVENSGDEDSFLYKLAAVIAIDDGRVNSN